MFARALSVISKDMEYGLAIDLIQKGITNSNN